ncbi:MAG: glycoside hydrolase family 19 protein [Parvibaculaceae bacterium]
MQIDAAMLKRIAPRGRPEILAGFAQALSERGAAIERPLELAHFVTQNAHESDGFRTVVEYASGKAYEGRKDLGNVQRGDGPRFKGRGTIQLTGRANYRAFTHWAGAQRADAPDFEAEPEKLAEAPWCFLAGLWYWRERRIGALVKGDADDIVRVTKAVNGGLNGLDDRKRYLARAVAEIANGAPVRNAQPAAEEPPKRTNVVARDLPERKKGAFSMNTAVNKAIVAFLTSTVALFATLGLVLPEWVTPELIERIGYWGALLFSLIGGGLTGWLTWLVPNKG